MEKNYKLNDWMDDNIGQIKLVKDWLKFYGIPFKAVDIKRIKDDKGSLKSFEVLVDKATMLKHFKDEPITPEFIKTGKITITFAM